jgi:hypothetical protein
MGDIRKQEAGSRHVTDQCSCVAKRLLGYFEAPQGLTVHITWTGSASARSDRRGSGNPNLRTDANGARKPDFRLKR